MVCNWVKVFDYLNLIFDDFQRKQPRISFWANFVKTGHSVQKGAKKFQWDRVVCDYCHKQIAISGFSDK